MARNLRSVPATLASAGLLLLGIGTATPSKCRQRFGHGLIVGSVTRFHLRYSRHDDVDHHLSGRDEFLVLRNMVLWQQAIVIGLLSMGLEVLIFCGEYLIQNVTFNPLSLWSGVFACILWPWMFYYCAEFDAIGM